MKSFNPCGFFRMLISKKIVDTFLWLVDLSLCFYFSFNLITYFIVRSLVNCYCLDFWYLFSNSRFLMYLKVTCISLGPNDIVKEERKGKEKKGEACYDSGSWWHKMKLRETHSLANIKYCLIKKQYKDKNNIR